jgi:hypothetical protein
MKKNYFNFWANKFITDGLSSIKLVIGIGLSFALAYSLNFVTGFLCMSYVFIDALITKQNNKI